METPHDEELTVRVGTKDIYDAIIGAVVRLDAIADSVNGVNETLRDHETRIRSLERWKYGLPIGAVAALVPAVIALLK